MIEKTSLKEDELNTASSSTAIQRCVERELERYFDVLEGEAPRDLYRMVMHQVEEALIRSVMEQCRGNQSKAATWLGISRGTLRCKLSDSNHN